MSSPVDVLSAIRPRVRHAPRAVDNEVDDAVFLSSKYGLTPDPWQEDVLEDWLGLRRDGRWAAARCGLAVARQNGKNGVIEVRELFGMIALGEKFLHTAHEVKTARKAFLRIKSFFDNEQRYPELFRLVETLRQTNGQEAIVLRNGGSVEFVARSKNSGRGFTVDVLVLDEAQALTDDELEAIGPTISAAPLGNPQVILTGTPPNPEKHQTGEVFTRIRCEAGTDARLAWTDFGVADGPMPDVGDDALVHATNPGLQCGRLLWDVIVGERTLYSPAGFARERLGWWGDPATEARGRIDLAQWALLGDAHAKPKARPRVALSIEVSSDREWSTIGVCEDAAPTEVRPGPTDLVFVKSRRGMSWVVDEVVRMRDKHKPVEIGLDPAGKAGEFLADLKARGVDVEPFSSRDMQQSCGGFQSAVAEARLVHLGQGELDTAVRSAITRNVGDAEVWDRREGGPDISPLVAASMAAHSLRRNARKRYDLLDSVR